MRILKSPQKLMMFVSAVLLNATLLLGCTTHSAQSAAAAAPTEVVAAVTTPTSVIKKLTGTLSRRGPDLFAAWTVRSPDGKLWELDVHTQMTTADQTKLLRQFSELHFLDVVVTGETSETLGKLLLSPVFLVTHIERAVSSR